MSAAINNATLRKYLQALANKGVTIPPPEIKIQDILNVLNDLEEVRAAFVEAAHELAKYKSYPGCDVDTQRKEIK